MCIPDENFEARLRDFFEVEGTLEIKSDEINEKAITECYHNMFAGATKDYYQCTVPRKGCEEGSNVWYCLQHAAASKVHNVEARDRY